MMERTTFHGNLAPIGGHGWLAVTLAAGDHTRIGKFTDQSRKGARATAPWEVCQSNIGTSTAFWQQIITEHDSRVDASRNRTAPQ